MSQNMLDGGQVIVDYLVREKVPYVFGLCGHGNIGFIDALYERSDEIKTISVHHETVAGFMADVYYRVCGRPTATFTSCGPGSANLPIALANSYLDSVPFLAVTGNVPTSQFNRGAFQELYRHYQADFPSTVRAYCKRVFQPTRGDMVPLAIRQAWKTMVTGRPGPVVLDVPFDIFKEAAAEETPKPEEWNANISSPLRRRSRRRQQGARHAACGRAAGHPGRPGRQIRWRGGRPAARSRSGCAFRSPGRRAAPAAIDSQHPLALGLVARNGPYHANHAARTADVLLALGVRFDDRTSSSWLPGYSFTIPPTRLIHVDIDPDEIAPQLSGRARADGGCAHLPAPAAWRSSMARRDLQDGAGAGEVARHHRRLSQASGTRSSRRALSMMRRRSIRNARPTRSTGRCPRTPSW